jgi:type IV pilus assembly protein PilA
MEAKNNLDTMNRAQQAYHLEKNAFSNSIADLGRGIKTKTENYNYSTRTTSNAVFNYGTSRKDNLKSYVGAVFWEPNTDVNPQAAKDEAIARTILCEAYSPDTIQPAVPTLRSGILLCGSGTTEVGR